MHQLFAKQLAKATRPNGEVDIARLGDLVSAALEQADSDRRRTDRSIAPMIEELDRLNRDLERAVAERTQELHQREAELRAQNERFEAAINNLPQGLATFDARGDLVICNRRYIDMYRLKPEHAARGTRLIDILRHRLAVGTFSGDPQRRMEAALNALAMGDVASHISDLPDGRTISISRRAIPGCGWVTTHEDITERRRVERKIVHMAHHDALTDLPNRVLLGEWIERALKRLEPGRGLAVHYIDLDHFKTVNDTLGHPVGDELLLLVADRLRRNVRENELVARVGGDEFAVVQIGIAEPGEAAALARRIRDTIAAPYNLNGHIAVVDASIGIALAPADGREPATLMKHADLALYRAKAEGRGAFRLFEPDMDARMQKRRSLELALREALPNGEFELHYQPVVDLATDAVTSCEALLRWRHPERGLVGPGEFVPIAEEIGLIVPLGDWVIRRAFADAAAWPDHIKVAVNLSPTQLADGSIVTTVLNALAATRLKPQNLIFEITEAVLMSKTDALVDTLHRLRDLGAQIALDDFGTGYSSLSYLRSFPFDKIKIDRSFIVGLDEGAESASIVRAITGLADSLAMATVAEGVETEHQLSEVRALGCDEMQGYLFSRPMPAADLRRMFGRRAAFRRRAAA